MLLKLVRNALGAVVVCVDWVSRPKAIKRSPIEQSRVQSAMNGLSLYQFRACPFCIKTRRAIHALGVDIELRRKMWAYLKSLNEQGVTIILTTHYLEEAESLCRRIAIIDEGKIIEQGSHEELLEAGGLYAELWTRQSGGFLGVD